MCLKILAFYLPQFHEIPENNKWWGKGFTDWVNVKKAKPLFKGHYQPRKPLNNNYYDLSDVNVMKWQANLAKEYGIYGFCYYHYWFNGKLLLEKPLENMLKDKEVNIPFCLAWGNESWTRTWDGLGNNVLIHQSYGGKKEWAEHFEYLIKFFLDERYIKINNKPMFLIYRTEHIPNIDEMIDFWNELSTKYGFNGIYLVEMLTGFQKTVFAKNSSAVVEFEPNYTLGLYSKFNKYKPKYTFYYLYNEYLRIKLKSPVKIVSYDIVWKMILNRKNKKFRDRKTFLGAYIGWDNTPRKEYRGSVHINSTPENFGKYFSKLLKKADKLNSEFIFINAWNEWAEGTYLEPDEKYGYKFLEEIKRKLNK